MDTHALVGSTASLCHDKVKYRVWNSDAVLIVSPRVRSKVVRKISLLK